MPKDIFNRLRTMLVDEFGADPATVTLESSFRGTLDLDSLETAQLILELEDLFKIEIPDDDAEKLFTVGDAVRYAETHL
jgi:acyl carrier protein